MKCCLHSRILFKLQIILYHFKQYTVLHIYLNKITAYNKVN